MSIEIGQVIDGKYKIVRLLGQGGMGSVYEGTHVVIGRRVAIKVLNLDATQELAAARFEREAKAAARIGNDHILETFDVGVLYDGQHYLIAEYLDGQSLEQRLREHGPMTPDVAIPIVLELLEGLQAAHRAGVLHRDLKPGNVFLLNNKIGKKDFVKIIDFGISKFQTLEEEKPGAMTATTSIIGSPRYLAPEQARGAGDVTFLCDIYAAGMILYEMLSGTVAFAADNLNDMLFKIVLEAPNPIVSLVPGLDPALAALVHKALEKEPSARFRSATEFAEALLSWLQRRIEHSTEDVLPVAAHYNAVVVAATTGGTQRSELSVSHSVPAMLIATPLAKPARAFKFSRAVAVVLGTVGALTALLLVSFRLLATGDSPSKRANGVSLPTPAASDTARRDDATVRSVDIPGVSEPSTVVVPAGSASAAASPTTSPRSHLREPVTATPPHRAQPRQAVTGSAKASSNWGY